MQGFAFIELGVDAAAIVLTFEITQQEDRLYEPSVFLQGTGQ